MAASLRSKGIQAALKDMSPRLKKKRRVTSLVANSPLRKKTRKTY